MKDYAPPFVSVVNCDEEKAEEGLPLAGASRRSTLATILLSLYRNTQAMSEFLRLEVINCVQRSCDLRISEPLASTLLKFSLFPDTY